MDVRAPVGLKPAMKIEMTREAFARLSFAAEMGDDRTHGQSRPGPSQWFHEHSTTIRDNLFGVQIWGIQTVGGPIRNGSIDNFNGIAKIPRISARLLRNKIFSLEVSKSGLNDLITSPHRDSSIDAILLSKTLPRSKPSALTGSRVPRIQKGARQKICHPVTGAWSPFLTFG